MRGCESNGVEKSLAEKIFELLTHFADYGFNKSHSAAYGLLAWQTAYLKAHYPAEYMAAMMSGTPDVEKIAGYIELSQRMGIKVLPPDINAGSAHFAVDGGAIRFGLAAVKTVGEGAVDYIVEERQHGRFKSLADFCGRLEAQKVPRRSLENLIKCGAFDSVDKRRTALLASLDSAMEAGSKRYHERRSGAISLFAEEELHETNSTLPNVKESSPNEILAWEKETLGFYISGHPLDDLRERFSALKTSKDLGKFIGRRVKVGGLITEVRRIMTKRGESMAFIKVEDFDGMIDVTLFPPVFSKSSNVASVDEVVVVEGRVDNVNDTISILADRITAAEFYAADFWLTIPAELEKPSTFDKLRKIFAEHVGTSRVSLNRFGEWKRIPQKISDGSDLRGELIALLGVNNVKIY